MSQSNPNSIESLSFETALKELEELTQKLESGQAGLEDSIKLFERGSELKAFCEGRLQAAQMKLEQIVKSESGIATEKFEGSD